MKKALLWAVFLLLLPGNIFLAVNVCRRMFFYLAYTGGMPLVKGQEIQFFNPEFVVTANSGKSRSEIYCFAPQYILSMLSQNGEIIRVDALGPKKRELSWRISDSGEKYFTRNDTVMADYNGDWLFDAESGSQNSIFIDGKRHKASSVNISGKTAVMPDNSVWLWQKDHWQKAENMQE